MASRSNSQVEAELAELRAELLRGRPRVLEPDEGDEAFQQHKLLASAVHRAAKLDQRKGESETDAWVRYLVKHFPAGRNSEADARPLFSDWRTSLLKQDTPGPRVTVTHGQSALHWQRDESGHVCLNLEDAWDDYAASVDSFIEHLRVSLRRKVVLARWRKQRRVVEPFIPTSGAIAGATGMSSPMSASFSSSQTTVTTSHDALGLRVPIVSARSVSANAPDENSKRG